MTAILSFVAWKFLSSHIAEIAAISSQPSAMALTMTGQWLASGVALLLVVFLMAVIDVPLQAYLFKSRLKMSHEEVKQ
ncbi:EscU/YscU/HrcU family type III secretion system export apparatus switch protein, partial [Streptomyces sp. URMC 126]|uniref:EscU/YscU/HrcU family type III secretion system export apparatus switch protein n=1 Tax=Streptomyces sp. URMC 126 TaxID=3423401 RepID=UPI003F53971A